MVIVNDLPDHVRVTINGLQTRLKDLDQQDLTMPVNASDLTTPGVVERAPQLSSVSLPVGLHIEKVQPDRLELQVDRLVKRSVPVKAHFELPEGWQVKIISVKPQQVELTGPEVWLEALREVDTTPIRPDLKEGSFETSTGIESPSGKAIRLFKTKWILLCWVFCYGKERACTAILWWERNHDTTLFRHGWCPRHGQ